MDDGTGAALETPPDRRDRVESSQVESGRVGSGRGRHRTVAVAERRDGLPGDGTALFPPAPSATVDTDIEPLGDAFAELTDRFVRLVELAAAALFALLFAVGVIDLALAIVGSVRNGTITDPLVVIGFIDTGLLLLIIVEVYQTVVAYIQEQETRQIVRLVAYTGVIAMVRKAIIFRTGEYPSTFDALLAAVAYTVIILGLVGLLYVERVSLPSLAPKRDRSTAGSPAPTADGGAAPDHDGSESPAPDRSADREGVRG
jgi:uncharacterized membrane protein (DUF373 family)